MLPWIFLSRWAIQHIGRLKIEKTFDLSTLSMQLNLSAIRNKESQRLAHLHYFVGWQLTALDVKDEHFGNETQINFILFLLNPKGFL